MPDKPDAHTVRWVKDRLRIHHQNLVTAGHMTMRSATRDAEELEAWFDGTGGCPIAVLELVLDALAGGVEVPATLLRQSAEVELTEDA